MGERMICLSIPPSFTPCRKTGHPSSLDFSLKSKSLDIFSAPPMLSSQRAVGAHKGRKIRYDVRMNSCVPQCSFAEDGKGKNPFLFSLGRTIG
jgi:hypothetical protein